MRSKMMTNMKLNTWQAQNDNIDRLKMTILAGSICGGVWGVLSPAGSMGPQPLISAYSSAVHLMRPLISIANHNYNDNHQHDHDHNHHNHHHDHHHNHDDQHKGRGVRLPLPLDRTPLLGVYWLMWVGVSGVSYYPSQPASKVWIMKTIEMGKRCIFNKN